MDVGWFLFGLAYVLFGAALAGDDLRAGGPPAPMRRVDPVEIAGRGVKGA
jgi:hypothetical protein